MVKQTQDGYIIAVGEGIHGQEITAEEYALILAVIADKPHKEGKDYLLREDLTWEEIDINTEE